VTSTTGAPTTTLSPEQQDDADIRALHDRFYRMLDVSGNPPQPHHPEIAETTTGIERQRWEELMQQLVDLNEHYDGTVVSTILSVRLADSDHAAIKDCTADSSVRRAADQSVVERGNGEHYQTELHAVRTPAGWRVEDWFTGGAVACDS
jgi:hypothetical protein